MAAIAGSLSGQSRTSTVTPAGPRTTCTVAGGKRASICIA